MKKWLTIRTKNFVLSLTFIKTDWTKFVILKERCSYGYFQRRLSLWRCRFPNRLISQFGDLLEPVYRLDLEAFDFLCELGWVRNHETSSGQQSAEPLGLSLKIEDCISQCFSKGVPRHISVARKSPTVSRNVKNNCYITNLRRGMRNSCFGKSEARVTRLINIFIPNRFNFIPKFATRGVQISRLINK